MIFVVPRPNGNDSCGGHPQPSRWGRTHNIVTARTTPVGHRRRGSPSSTSCLSRTLQHPSSAHTNFPLSERRIAPPPFVLSPEPPAPPTYSWGCTKQRSPTRAAAPPPTLRTMDGENPPFCTQSAKAHADRFKRLSPGYAPPGPQETSRASYVSEKTCLSTVVTEWSEAFHRALPVSCLSRQSPQSTLFIPFSLPIGRI